MKKGGYIYDPFKNNFGCGGYEGISIIRRWWVDFDCLIHGFSCLEKGG
jgi:hypothetical protein